MKFDRDELKEIGHELNDLGNVLSAASCQIVGNVSAQSVVDLAARILERVSGVLLDAAEADEKAASK